MLPNLIKDIQNHIGSPFWADNLDELKQYISGRSFHDNIVNSVLDEINGLLTKGRQGRALKSYNSCYALNQQKSFKIIKRNGILRASKYHFNCSHLRFITSKILSLLLKYHYLINYYHILSCDALLPLVPKVNSLYKNTINYIKTYRKSIVKDLFATVDILFMKNYYYDFRKDTDDIAFYSKEEISEAVSYLILLI